MTPPRRTARTLLFLALGLVMTPLWADDGVTPPEDKLLGWSLTPGIGVRVVSLDVKRRADGYTGTLTNDGSFSEPIYLSFDIETPSWMLTPVVGLSLRSHSQTFRLSRQEVSSSTSTSGKDYANLGTRVQGYYSYIGPTLFYRLVDATGDSRWGLGYGYWKTWFRGDIILSPNDTATPDMPRTAIDGSIQGNTGPMLFWQVRGKKMLFEIAISNVAFSNSNFRYNLRELMMGVGYQLRF